MWLIIIIIIVVVVALGLGLGLGLKPKSSTSPGQSSSPGLIPNTNLRPGNASIVTAVSLKNPHSVPLGPYQAQLIIDAVPAQNVVDQSYWLHYLAEYTYKTETGHRNSYFATANRFKPPPGNLVVDISGTNVVQFESVYLTVWIENPAGEVGPKTYLTWPGIT
jgi:hypothetical protein